MDKQQLFQYLAERSDYFEELDSCPWCGFGKHEDWGQQTIEGFHSVQCQGCGVVYVRRRLNGAGLDYLYGQYHEVRQQGDKAKKRSKAHDLELEFIYRFATSGRVLDVGCGGGFMLERMPEDRWERWGTEVSEDAVARARGVLGDDRIFAGNIEDIDLPVSEFDLAIARGVIEHIPYPRQFLQRVAELVKPRGHLFLSGPNLDSFCAQFYKERWRLHYPEAHLFHFNVPILTEALSEHGFTLLADAYHYLETPYADPYADILQIAKDIQVAKDGNLNAMSAESPAFFGNRYTAIWAKN